MGEEESMEMSPVMMAFFLVPLADFFVYYKINDFNSASQSDWTMAGNVALAGGAIKLVGIAAHMAAGGASTSGDVNMYYGACAFGAIVSVANVVMMKNGDDEEVVEDYYTEDYGAEDDSAATDDYGYYGYY